METYLLAEKLLSKSAGVAEKLLHKQKCLSPNRPRNVNSLIKRKIYFTTIRHAMKAKKENCDDKKLFRFNLL